MAQKLPTQIIVQKLCQGEDIEFITRYLYRTYERPLKAYVRRLGASYDDADDLIQEVMLAFLQQARGGYVEERSGTDVGAYLFGIARRKYLKKMQSETRRQERQYVFTSTPVVDETPETIVAETDYQNWAAAHFQQLGTVCQQILTAFYRDGLSLEEIAIQYDLGTAGAVKMRKFRCIQKLLKLAEL